jgi:hypothetical protein
MRVELVNGRYLLCGAILPSEKVTVGQVWAPASGGNYTISVTKREADRVTYEGVSQPEHSKDAFAFQCRYCLVLETNQIPLNLR